MHERIYDATRDARCFSKSMMELQNLYHGVVIHGNIAEKVKLGSSRDRSRGN